jgi:hypothetical protein
VDADTREIDPRTLFTPDSHRLALDPDVTIVRGGRGAGKTVWFKALQDDALRELASREYRLDRLNNIEPLPGFGSSRTDAYPSQRVLEHLINQSIKPTDIWMSVALTALKAKEISALHTWEQRIEWLKNNPERAEEELIAADREAGRSNTTKLILFDALERLHSDRRYADVLVNGILRLSLDLRTSTRNIRTKIFIRHDMLSENQLNFPDASKLSANQTDLTWSATSLYGLLFHHLGNADSAHSTTFHKNTKWVSGGGQRHEIPPSLSGGQHKQRETFVEIAGPYMGTDHRKGHTYTWLPNHLADGNDQVSPRSFLSALFTAADNTETRYSDHKFSLHWDRASCVANQGSRNWRIYTMGADSSFTTERTSGPNRGG